MHHFIISMSEYESETISPLNYYWLGAGKGAEIADGDGSWLRSYNPSIRLSLHSSIHFTDIYGALVCVRPWESDIGMAKPWSLLSRTSQL